MKTIKKEKKINKYNIPKIKNYCTQNIESIDKRKEIEDELNKAIEKHNNRDVLGSLEGYRKVLEMVGEPNEDTIENYAFALLNISQILILIGYTDRDQSKIQESLETSKLLLKMLPMEPQGHWNMFRCYAYLKDAEKALAHLTIYEQQAPENLVKEVLKDIEPFLYTLGVSIYKEKGTKKNVEGDLFMKKVLEINPDNLDAMYSLGYSYLDSGLKKEGIEILESIIAKNKDFWQAHMRLGDIYKENRDNSNAKKHYKEIERIQPEEPFLSTALYELGSIYIAKGDLEKSENYFKKSLEKNEDQPLVKANLANVYSNQGKYQEAMETLQECVERLNRPSLHIAIATLAAKLEIFETTKIHLEKGAIQNKSYGGMEEFVRILSNCEIVDSGDNYAIAMECFEMADNLVQLVHEISPSVRTLFYFRFAKFLERLGKLEESKDFYNRVVNVENVAENDPLPLLAKYSIGQICVNKQDNIDEGLDFLKDALDQFVEKAENKSFNPKTIQIKSSFNLPESQNLEGLLYEKIGTAHSLKGEHDTAVEYLEKALENNKNNPIIIANLGNSYVALGEVDKAILLMQECLQEHSHFAPLHSTLCVAFCKTGNWERAAHHGEMSLGLDQSFQPEVLNKYLAVAFKELGNLEKANQFEEKVKQFEEKIKQSPSK